MKNLKKVLALSLSLSLALPLAACGDQGETGKGGGSTGSYPSSTITVVCPWDAGGTSDGLCRIVSEIGARDEYFSVNMVVQNSSGAGTRTQLHPHRRRGRHRGYHGVQERSPRRLHPLSGGHRRVYPSALRPRGQLHH